MKRILLLLAATLALASPVHSADLDRPVVAIRPLGHVDPSVVARVERDVARAYGVRVVVLDRGALPREAFYAPRSRYRAERVLGALERETDARYAKVVGLTSHDISTSTETHADWGIFGLGEIAGRPAVVSTHRLRGQGVPRERFLDRVAKVVNHELGHTFGLEHCPEPGCLMEDAGGTIASVDSESGELCDACRARLAVLAPSRSPQE